MMKRTGIVIALGLCGFGLGSVLAWMLEREAAPAADRPSALRHITQLPPPPVPERTREKSEQGRAGTAEEPRSGH